MMTKFSISKRVLALLFTLTVFFVASGFTFSPSQPINFRGYVDFSSVSSTENVTLLKPTWYAKQVTAGGKTGVAGSASWDNQIFMQMDMDKFADIHKVKVTVEWYDAIGQPANNWFTIQYPTTEGSYANGGSVKTSQTESWETTVFQLEGVDFARTNILNNQANLVLRAPGGCTTMGTEDTSDDFWGVLIHSITIEPLEESYRLEQLYEGASASYRAGTTDVTDNLSVVSADVAPRTITDANGVTMTGKAYATASNKEFRLLLDQEKFADASAVNITIKWFDALDTTTAKNCINVRWQSSVLNTSWNNYLKETGSAWQSKTGTWKTSTYTLTDCDFANITAGYNLHIYTANNLSDFGTPDDTSDDIYGIIISEVSVTPVNEFTFGGLKFSDASGSELTALNANGEFHTELTVYRTGGNSTADVTLIVALIDEANGKLERIAYQTQVLAPNSSKLFSVCFVNPETVEGKSITLMVWDSLTGMKPISNPLTCR